MDLPNSHRIKSFILCTEISQHLPGSRHSSHVQRSPKLSQGQVIYPMYRDLPNSATFKSFIPCRETPPPDSPRMKPFIPCTEITQIFLDQVDYPIYRDHPDFPRIKLFTPCTLISQPLLGSSCLLHVERSHNLS